MSTDTRPTPAPYVPPITPDELKRLNAKAMALLEQWATEGDEQEQRETMAVIRKALGPERVAGYRSAFR